MLMGIREYGRHRNVSHVAVLKALRSGRIQQTADGLIDSDQADRDWQAANTPRARERRMRRRQPCPPIPVSHDRDSYASISRR